MKSIGKLKLNMLSKAEMEKREMNNLRGGDCGCGCNYGGSGGSSAQDNAYANQASGYTQSGGGNNYYYSNGTGCWTRSSDGATMTM